LTWPEGTELVVTCKEFDVAAETVILSCCWAVSAGEDESATWTVKEELPDCDGVPVIAPDGESTKPVGSDPDATDQVYGAMPPVAINDVE
jgi:hypothetical protein